MKTRYYLALYLATVLIVTAALNMIGMLLELKNDSVTIASSTLVLLVVISAILFIDIWLGRWLSKTHAQAKSLEAKLLQARRAMKDKARDIAAEAEAKVAYKKYFREKGRRVQECSCGAVDVTGATYCHYCGDVYRKED